MFNLRTNKASVGLLCKTATRYVKTANLQAIKIKCFGHFWETWKLIFFTLPGTSYIMQAPNNAHQSTFTSFSAIKIAASTNNVQSPKSLVSRIV